LAVEYSYVRRGSGIAGSWDIAMLEEAIQEGSSPL
jgi:hypothetical protein